MGVKCQFPATPPNRRRDVESHFPMIKFMFPSEKRIENYAKKRLLNVTSVFVRKIDFFFHFIFLKLVI